ncbi:MAG: histidinol-phosphate transaminase [Deltaproteobacteria bacterium]|nr:histidinol-phosphate transaminase [Deltaproteobacteria bacterium]
MELLSIPPHISMLTPYEPGLPIAQLKREKKLKKIVKLASNENPLGASPKALAAIKKMGIETHRYPDPSTYELTQKLSKIYKVPESHLFCASGTDAILEYLIMTFTEEHDEVLTSEGTFIGIYVNTLKLKRKLKLVPLNHYQIDLEALRKTFCEKTKIIYLANPNNPTGLLFTRGQLEAFLEKIPKTILVILDEAYDLYARSHPQYPDGFSLSYPNLVVTRTFSKSYGLAGLRIGYGLGSERIIQELKKVRLPFEPSVLSQKAALAALDDDAFLSQTLKTNLLSLSQIRKTLHYLSIRYLNTYANFLLLLFQNETTARTFLEACLNRGLILRHTKSFGIPNGIRINSGTLAETAFACKIIKEVYQTL